MRGRITLTFYGRSDVIAKNGMVATSQPLATQAGVRVLQEGGNAVDAAVAAAAVLDVVEPFSTGCGGDAFVLLHQPDARSPLSSNGSGRSGSLVTLDEILEKGWTQMPSSGGPPVTVPGAMDLWFHMVEKYGALPMGDVLRDAIDYAENGFPVSPIVAAAWSTSVVKLVNRAARQTFSIRGKAPKVGETMRNPDLGGVFRTVVEEGVEEFYSGDIAKRIVRTVRQNDGFLTMQDMKDHKTVDTEPLSSDYRGTKVYEHPPNGQGFAALQMLNMLKEFNIRSHDSLSAERYHLMIEAKKLAYADLHQHNADPDFYKIPLDTLLSEEYAKKRSGLVNPEESAMSYSSGVSLGQDTVYLATADNEGRAVSFINSLYTGFGSGLVVPGTGIKLQNRGTLFSLDPEHPNCYAPKKLPFHTIIPGALYNDDAFLGVFGIMGGSHQAQAHGQVVSNFVDYGMKPQQAIDHPRFHHNQATNTLAIERGIPEMAQYQLLRLGHKVVEASRGTFGGGQAILRLGDVWIAGSDHRKDGMAAGY